MIGRPFAFLLTGGNAADGPVAPLLLNGLKGARYLLGDKGYDANVLRKRLRQSAIVPVIPGRSNRKRSIVYDRQRYKERHLIENAFWQAEGFSPCCHALRQTGQKLPVSHRPRHSRCILVVIESQP